LHDIDLNGYVMLENAPANTGSDYFYLSEMSDEGNELKKLPQTYLTEFYEGKNLFNDR